MPNFDEPGCTPFPAPTRILIPADMATTGLNAVANRSAVAEPSKNILAAYGLGELRFQAIGGTLTRFYSGNAARWVGALNSRLQIRTASSPVWPAGSYGVAIEVESPAGVGTQVIRYGNSTGYLSKSVPEGSVTVLDGSFTFNSSARIELITPSGLPVDLLIHSMAIYPPGETPAVHDGIFDGHLLPAWAHGAGFKLTSGALDNTDAAVNTGGGTIQPKAYPDRTSLTSYTASIVVKADTIPTVNSILFCNDYDPTHPGGAKNTNALQGRVDSTGTFRLFVDGQDQARDGPDSSRFNITGAGWIIYTVVIGPNDRRAYMNGIPYFTCLDPELPFSWAGLDVTAIRLLAGSNSQNAYITSSSFNGHMFGFVDYENVALTEDQVAMKTASMIDRLTHHGLTLGGPDHMILVEGDSIDAWTAEAGGSYPERLYKDTVNPSRPLFFRLAAEGGSNLADTEARLTTITGPAITAALARGMKVVCVLPCSVNNKIDLEADAQDVYDRMVAVRDAWKALDTVGSGANVAVIGMTGLPRGTGGSAGYDAGMATVRTNLLADAGTVWDEVVDFDATPIGYPYQSTYRQGDGLHLASNGQAERTAAVLPAIEACLP